MKNFIIVLLTLLLLSCYVSTKESAETLWKEGQQHRIEENLKDAITSFKVLITKYPNHDLSAEAQFQIADIFLNDTKDFEYAIKEFKAVVEIYPNHEVAKKSLFMIAYIYNNNINAYSDAMTYYNLFKEKYPDDELIPSVEYELDGLKGIQSQIDSLNLILNQKLNI